MGAKSVERILKKIEDIPTLPIISRQILNLLNDENIPLQKIANVIEKDMSLATKLLKVANSPFYGTISKVSSIDHALAILGMNETKAILIAFSVHKFFSDATRCGIDRKKFWRHSIITSQVAKLLSLKYKVDASDTLFLAGLIHDIGKVIFDQYFHEEFLHIVDYVATKKERFRVAEKEVVGVTHGHIAAKVLQQWQFPEKIIYHVYYHHIPWHDKKHTTGSIILYLANYLTKLAGYPSMATEYKVEAAKLASSNAMDFISQSGFNLDEQKIVELVEQIKNYIASEGHSILGFLED